MIRIIHLADIHIRNDKEFFNIYEYCFNNLIYQLKNLDPQPDFIVIAGDIVHERKNMSGECSKLCYMLFSELIKIPKFALVTILGNHDVDINDVNYVNLVENNFNFMSLIYGEKIQYYPTSGIYECNNVIFGVVDPYMRSETHNFKHLDIISDKLKIGLFHEDFYGASLDNGNIVKNATLNSTHFANYDAVMGGHIHKQQQLDIKTWYAGSTIQQNTGESHIGHGFLVWDFENINNKWAFKVKNYEVDNPRARIIFNLEKNDKGEIIDLTMGKIPLDPYKWLIKINMTEYEASQNKNFQDFIKEKQILFKSNPFSINYIRPVKIIMTENKINTQTREFHSEILRKILNEKSIIDEEFIKHIDNKYNEIYNKHYNRQTFENLKLKLHKMSFSNIYCFGENCKINFDHMYNTITIIDGDNEIGKSKILDIIFIALYGAVDKYILNKFIRIGQKKANITIEFTVDDIEYIINRNFTRAETRKNNEEYKCEGLVDLYVLKNGECISHNSTKAEVDLIITNLLCDYKTLESTSFMKQNCTHKLLHGTIDEKKIILSRIFQIDNYDNECSEYEAKYKEIKKHINTINTQYNFNINEELTKLNLEKESLIENEKINNSLLLDIEKYIMSQNIEINNLNDTQNVLSKNCGSIEENIKMLKPYIDLSIEMTEHHYNVNELYHMGELKMKQIQNIENNNNLIAELENEISIINEKISELHINDTDINMNNINNIDININKYIDVYKNKNINDNLLAENKKIELKAKFDIEINNLTIEKDKEIAYEQNINNENTNNENIKMLEQQLIDIKNKYNNDNIINNKNDEIKLSLLELNDNLTKNLYILNEMYILQSDELKNQINKLKLELNNDNVKKLENEIAINLYEINKLNAQKQNIDNYESNYKTISHVDCARCKEVKEKYLSLNNYDFIESQIKTLLMNNDIKKLELEKFTSIKNELCIIETKLNILESEHKIQITEKNHEYLIEEKNIKSTIEEKYNDIIMSNKINFEIQSNIILSQLNEYRNIKPIDNIINDINTKYTQLINNVTMNYNNELNIVEKNINQINNLYNQNIINIEKYNKLNNIIVCNKIKIGTLKNNNIISIEPTNYINYTYNKLINELNELNNEINNIQNSKKNIELLKENENTKINNIKTILLDIPNKLKICDANILLCKNNIKLLENLNNELIEINAMISILDKNGIFAKLMQSKINQFNNAMNQVIYACATKNNEEDKIERLELQCGEKNESKYNLIFKAKNSDLEEDAEYTSGYRRFIIGLSISIAMQKCSTGAVLDGLFIDEAMSVCDNKNITKLKNFINDIHDDNTMPSIICIISHDPSVKSMKIDNLLQIKVNDKKIGNHIDNLDENENWNICDAIVVKNTHNTHNTNDTNTQYINKNESIDGGKDMKNKYLIKFGKKLNKKNELKDCYYCTLCKSEIFKGDHYGHVVGNAKDKKGIHV